MRLHLSSSRSILYRFLILYGSLYAGFGVQSPYLPILLDNRHLRPETIALALAAGTAMRLMAAEAVARLADRLDAPKVFLAICTTAAALIGLGYLPAQGAWLLIAVGVLHSAALAPLPPLSDTLALGAAAPAGSGGAVIHYGWLRGCGSAAFALGLVLSGQVIGHFGIVVIVWLNAALLAAAAPMALCVPQLLATGGHAPATPSQARGVGVLLRLPLYRKMVLLAMLILWESCDAQLLCDDPLEQSRNQPQAPLASCGRFRSPPRSSSSSWSAVLCSTASARQVPRCSPPAPVSCDGQ